MGSYYKIGEDCLNLNVWVNSLNKEEKSVMVFFHGGSFGWGAASDPIYNGHNIVKKFDDIIIVTVKYRLGMIGFIDLMLPLIDGTDGLFRRVIAQSGSNMKQRIAIQ